MFRKFTGSHHGIVAYNAFGPFVETFAQKLPKRIIIPPDLSGFASDFSSLPQNVAYTTEKLILTTSSNVTNFYCIHDSRDSVFRAWDTKVPTWFIRSSHIVIPHTPKFCRTNAFG